MLHQIGKLINVFSKVQMLALYGLLWRRELSPRRQPLTLDGRPLPCHMPTPGLDPGLQPLTMSLCIKFSNFSDIYELVPFTHFCERNGTWTRIFIII